MRDFWYNAVTLIVPFALALLVFWVLWLIMPDAEKGQLRYEQCIAADKQWIEGNCLR